MNGRDKYLPNDDHFVVTEGLQQLCENQLHILSLGPILTSPTPPPTTHYYKSQLLLQTRSFYKRVSH